MRRISATIFLLLILVLSGNKKGFRVLFEKNISAESELATAGEDDWLNFYRSDDYAVTAYYYLDKP